MVWVFVDEIVVFVCEVVILGFEVLFIFCIVVCVVGVIDWIEVVCGVLVFSFNYVVVWNVLWLCGDLMVVVLGYLMMLDLL